MTGMPAALAFATAGRIALVSWARTMRTLAPFDDQRVDVGRLLLGLEVGVGVDVLAARGLDGLLDVRLVMRRPARLLEVVPRHADRAAGRRPRSGGGGGHCRRAPALAAGLPPLLLQAAAMIATTANDWRQSAYEHSLLLLVLACGSPSRIATQVSPARLPPSIRAITSSSLGRSRARRAPPRVGSQRRPGRRAGARTRARRRRAAAHRAPRSPGRSGPAGAAPAAHADRAPPRARRATNGWIRPNSPAEDDRAPGSNMLTRPASPIPSQRPTSVERAQGGRRAGLGLAQDGVDLGPAAAGRAARQAQQRRLADLGLPAADRAAAAGRAVRVDRHVADLAGVARRRRSAAGRRR